MRQLFARILGIHTPMFTIPIDLTDQRGEKLTSSTDIDHVVNAAYTVGYADALKRPRWEGTAFMVGEEKVGYVWRHPYHENKTRASLLHTPYGRAMFAIFDVHEDAKRFVEQHAMTEKQALVDSREYNPTRYRKE